MNNYKKFFDYCIHGNKLVYYWGGVNILGIDTTEPVTDYKEYYQFEFPLFSNDYFGNVEVRELNNSLLSEVGRCVNIDTSTLLNSDEFIFLCITKKPVASYSERVGFQFRINNHGYEDTFNKMENFLIHQLKVSPVIIEKIYNVACQIFSENHFTTFPINIVGISKYSENDIPYAQLYITNNPDTSSGNINQISKGNVLQNTVNIVKTLNLNIDLCAVQDLIEFIYSKNGFLCFNGIDIHIDKIKKFKLYFRFTNILSSDRILNILCEKIAALNTISISYPDDVVDFIAITFVPTEKNEFVFNGVQIYRK